MITLHGFDVSTPNNKVRYVANYLGIEYKYNVINAFEGEHQTEAHRKLHPAGKVPVIEDEGFVLFESNAIIKYLAEKANSSLYPKEFAQRALVDQWMDFVSIHVGNGINRVFGNRVIFPRVGMEVDERSLQDGLSFLERFLPIIDDQLKANDHLAGNELTLADFTLIATLDPLELSEVDVSAYANLAKYRDRLRAEDFYQSCHKAYGDSLMAAA